MKKNLNKMVVLVAVAAITTLSSCVSSLYTSAGAYDDLYAVHDVEVIAAREKAEAEVRKAEAEARRAEALAEQAEWEAQMAKQNATLAQNRPAQPQQTTSSDGVIVVEEDGNDFVANTYESAYARRLRGFQSASYRMPSSYYNLRYNGTVSYVTAYDPAFYNIMVSGDEVWVEPKYISSMFGSWGAVKATTLISPWYYGWNRWPGFYDPWYYSWWGFPRYSWWDWNWSMCYGSYWGSWGPNLWWGWGGLYRPWHHHHYGWHNPHHHGGFWYGDMWGGGGGYWHRGGSYYGSRNNSSRLDGGGGRLPARGSSIVNRGSANSTPYRSPSSGTVYGGNSRGGRYAAALEQQRNGSMGRGNAVGSRSQATQNNQSPAYRGNTTTNRSSAVNRGTTSQSSSSSRNNSTSRSSSYSSSSSSSFGGSYSSGSRGGGGYSGGSSGGSRGGGSRGR